MKNVEFAPARPAFRVPIDGLPPLSGWAVQYVSGMESETGIKQGYWLSNWNATGEAAYFGFQAGLHMCFNEERDAIAVSEALRNEAEIETRVVKISRTPPVSWLLTALNRLPRIQE
jgi:hypothetical protein